MRYDWLMTGLAGDVDPQVAGEHIESLVEKYQEQLTTDEILADARHRASPIHDCFEWSDTKAAEKYRLRQASSIMRGLVVKTARGEKGERRAKTRAFVYVQIPGSARKSYIPVRSAMGRAELKEQVINDGLRRLERWIDSYGAQREFRFVARQVQKLRDRIEAEYMTAAGLR